MNPHTTPPPTHPKMPVQAVAATQKAASALRLGGWVGFCLQGSIALVSAVTLVFSMFSRGLESEAENPTVGFAILIGGVAVLTAAFGAWLCFRYTRFARRLARPDPTLNPEKSDTLRIIHIGMITGLVGLAIALLGAEVSITTLLAKALSQPQGAAIYTPDKIIRVLDILVVLINTNLIVANLVGVLTSLWLERRLD